MRRSLSLNCRTFFIGIFIFDFDATGNYYSYIHIEKIICLFLWLKILLLQLLQYFSEVWLTRKQVHLLDPESFCNNPPLAGNHPILAEKSRYDAWVIETIVSPAFIFVDLNHEYDHVFFGLRKIEWAEIHLIDKGFWIHSKIIMAKNIL